MAAQYSEKLQTHKAVKLHSITPLTKEFANNASGYYEGAFGMSETEFGERIKALEIHYETISKAQAEMKTTLTEISDMFKFAKWLRRILLAIGFLAYQFWGQISPI